MKRPSILEQLLFHPEEDDVLKKHYAYAWYVSQSNYHCAALVALKMLKAIRLKGSELLTFVTLKMGPSNFVCYYGAGEGGRG